MRHHQQVGSEFVIVVCYERRGQCDERNGPWGEVLLFLVLRVLVNWVVM